MVLKTSLSLLMALNGGFMILDGIHVLLNGKFFGPEEPGPWTKIFSKFGLNPFSLGVPFVLFGLAWLVGLTGLLLSAQWGWYVTVAIAVATLWYVPVGTAISIVVLVLVLIFRDRLIGG